MKKFFALLIVVLMLVPFVVACGDDTTTTTTTESTTQSTTQSTTESTTESTVAQTPKFSSKTTVLDYWDGRTLQVAASSWYATGAPWAIPEIYVVPDSEDPETGDKIEGNKNYGDKIQDAVLARKAFIKATYGVDVNFFKAGSAELGPKVAEVLQANDGTKWDIVMPRMTGIHDMVTAGYLFDMAGREYIDFRNDYFSDLSVKTWTAKGHTFYVTGGFSFLDKQLTNVMFFNKDVLIDATANEDAVSDLYDMVRNGEWVFEELVAIANASYSDKNGNGTRDEADRFGLSIYGLNNYYQYWGIQPASVDETTGEWVSNLGQTSLMNAITDAVVTLATADWTYQFSGSWGSNAAGAMKEGRLLFYCEVVQHIDNGIADGAVGIIPYPMLTAAQGRYYSATADSMVPVMGVCKLTQNRSMADYFVDVLSWTGDQYLIKAYLQTKSGQVETYEEVEMLSDYIFPNIVYNGGYGFGWGSMDPGVIGNAYKETTGEGESAVTTYKNVYATVYAEHLEAINAKLADMNAAWGNYTDNLPAVEEEEAE